jgi:glycosyltransferase involved in cell wall biosynthesis
MTLSADTQGPLISVYVACYNQERFVGEAIDGILAQTYRPIDILIIDDCSLDRTASVIESKLAEHPDRRDVRFVRNERNLTTRGVCKIGFGMTRGDFVVIGCGDDIWLPEMVSEFARTWLEEKVSLVAANAIYIDDNSNLLNRTFRDPDGRADDSFETLARDGANACCFGPVLGIERKLYTTFGLPPAHLEALDIMLPFYAYLLNGARFIDKPLFKYRVHAGNTSLSLTAEHSQGVEQLAIQEHAFYIHVAHSLFMQEELLRVSVEPPERYTELKQRILPLLTVQTVEMAKKLVRARTELDEARRRNFG